MIYNNAYASFINNGAFDNIITIFTPTYNRGNLINRTYDCLKKQTIRKFVWIIVNDGSTDNTDDFVKRFVDENSIPILYVSKRNGGKHSAFEVAFKETHTEYFMCMDDDDIYSSEAIETFLNEWDIIKAEGKYDKIGAIRTITQEEDGRIVSKKMFDRNLLGSRLDQTTLESNYLKHEEYENWTCYRTAALRETDLFSKTYWMQEQHKFFDEAIWQGRFARKFLCRYLFVVLREYRHDTKTSIIRSSKSRQHYVDMFINTKMILDEQLDFLKRNPKSLIKRVAIVSILRHKLHISLSGLLHHTNSTLLKVLYVLMIPLGYISRTPEIKD